MTIDMNILSETEFKKEYLGTFSDVPMSKIKILCLTINYPLAMSSYFISTMRRMNNIDLKVTGPFTGNWIPWRNGIEVPMRYVKQVEIPLPFAPNVGTVSYDLVKAQLKDWIPDIVLTIDAGIHWTYKPSDGIVCHIATDPHVLNYDYQRNTSDKFFNMQQIYMQGKDIWLPYAYEPTIHYPDDTIVKDHDAVLIGMPYAQRVEWINKLRERGVTVLFENAPIFDDYRIANNRARIGLNWSSMQDLNARFFELAAMKLCPVVNYVPYIDKFLVDGVDIMVFQNMDDAIEKVMYVKERPEFASIMANNAYTKILPETYDSRINQILKECGLYG